MNDYERILRHAIAELGESDESARYGVYERARTTVLKQLRAFDPPKTDEEIDQHLAALHAAVQHIESEYAPPTARAPVRPHLIEPEAIPLEPPQRGRMSLAIVAVAAAILVAAAGAYLFATYRPAEKPIAQNEPRAGAPAPAAAENTPATAKSEPSATATPARRGPGPAVATPAASDPQHASFILRRQRVFYRTTYPVGSVIVSRAQHFLYVVQPNQVAIRYAIGVGPSCENVAGLFHVTEKQDASADGRQAAFEPPAFYFDIARAVHRTVEPASVGESAKGGCFQVWDTDIADLYQRVQLNDRVIVVN
jgi:lipoprotein-anchoring transpeptidase ErfK/SrfK